MKLEHQVITLATAKKIKGLGINCKSLYWHHRMDNATYRIHPYSAPGYTLQGIEKNKKDYPAYTVAELGLMITGDDRGETTIWDAGEHTAYYKGVLIGKYPTEAESRAAMLIYLVEHHYVTAEEVNERFKSLA